MATRMSCSERGRLLNLYSHATAELSLMVSTLADQAGSYESAVFDRAWERCEEARYLCSQIQQQIYDHVREHRCALGIRPTSLA
jgi:hypothetical protein